MWHVICEPGDLSALCAFDGVKARGLKPLELVCPQMLVSSFRWEHRLGVDGHTFSFALSGEKMIEGTAVRGVLNRITWMQASLFPPTTSSADRTYASQEMAALFMSCLSALPVPVL